MSALVYAILANPPRKTPSTYLDSPRSSPVILYHSPHMKVKDWIRESNLIEGVDSSVEDARSQRAWNWLLKQDLLLGETILELHRRIMRYHLWKEAGRWRTCGVMVGGRVCPPWREVPSLHMMWLATWFAANTEERIKQAHIIWEKIHPFVDGNGRTGRMIMNFQRVKAGLEPLLIRFEERKAYYAWFS